MDAKTDLDLPPVAALTLCALGSEPGRGELGAYASTLTDACLAHPPPFGCAWYGEKYREFAGDPSWVAGSLVANAEKEGDGSRVLWELSGKITSEDTAEQVRQHAIDESRHATMYLSLLDLAFPEATDQRLREALRTLSPSYQQHDRPSRSEPLPERIVIDEIIQMNLGEIRTRIHQLLMRPVLLSLAPEEATERIDRIVASLMQDETAHIGYTAALIEAAIRDGHESFVRETMRARLKEFNEITMREVGEQRFVGE